MESLDIFISALRKGLKAYSKNWMALVPIMVATLILLVIKSLASQLFFLSPDLYSLIEPFVFFLATAIITVVLIRKADESFNKKLATEDLKHGFLPALKYALLLIVINGLPMFAAGFVLQAAGGVYDIAAAQQMVHIIAADFGYFLKNPLVLTPMAALLAAIAILYGALLVLTQFSAYYLVAARKGLIESINLSISLVKTSAAKFFVLWLMLGAAAIVLSFGSDALMFGARQVQLNYIDLTDLVAEAYKILNSIYYSFVSFPLMTIILVEYWRIAIGAEKP